MILAVSLLGGCGTIANLHGKHMVWMSNPPLIYKPRVYGGVRQHLETQREFEFSAFQALLALDFPATLVADTLTIPLVVLDNRDWDTTIAEWEEITSQRYSDLGEAEE